MKKFLLFSLGVVILIGLLSLLLPKGPQNLPSSQIQVHQILSNRLSPENCTPIGSTKFFSTAHWFWGFADGFLFSEKPVVPAFPVKIDVNGFPVMIKGGLFYPSHLVLEGEIDSAKSNLAYNPLRRGFPQPISSFSLAENEWGPIDGCLSAATSWRGAGLNNSPVWYGVNLGEPKLILSAVLEFLESGLTQLPVYYFLEFEKNGKWIKIPGQRFYPASPGSGQNLVQFPRFQAQKIRVVLQGGGLINFQLQGEGTRLPLVTEEKFVTEDNVFFSCFNFQNVSWHFPVNVHFTGLIPWGQCRTDKFIRGELNGQQIVLAAKNLPDSGETPDQIEFDLLLKPREQREIRFVIAGDTLRNQAQKKVEQWLSQNLPVARQVQNFDSWFAQNIPYFFSSNNCLNQAYYRHWNQVRLQLLQSQAQNYHFPAANSENPDTTINLVNQFIREIRWLREPSVAQNFVQNFSEHGLPHSDDFRAFLISGMWELNQVHPDWNFLAGQSVIFEKLLQQLAENHDQNQNHLLEITEEIGVAGFSSKMYVPDGGLESVGLNSEFFRACAVLDSTALFCGSRWTGLSQQVGQSLLERTWGGYFWPVGAKTGAPIFLFGTNGLKPFIYDLAEKSHLSAWENVLLRVRATMAAETGTLQPILFRAMLHTWQRFPEGPISQADLSQAFTCYFCKEYFTAIAGSDGTFIPKTPFDPTQPGVDFIITGIAGISAQANSNRLLLNPALPGKDFAFFALENLQYHGHKLTIIWDRPDAEDQFEDHRAGFDIYVDGRLAGASPRLERLVVKL